MSKSKSNKHPGKLLGYLESNRYYFWFLEATIILGFAYHFGITYQLHIPLVTDHLSNFLGSIILCLIIIGPKAFRTPHNKRVYYALFSVSLLNVFLEFIKPIGQFHLGNNFIVENFNTPDPWDALFGLIGVYIVFLARKRVQKN